jgi:hypothetical protein
VSIIHAMVRWTLGVLAPGTGTRRASARPVAPAPPHAPEALCPAVDPLPAHRSPYGLPVPLDGRASHLVRPYVLAAEREREWEWVRRRRRIALVLAADFGIDLDQYVVGAEGAA